MSGLFTPDTRSDPVGKVPVTLAQIRRFTAVAESLNFRTAAQWLGVHQSSLSRGITTLEEVVGAQLFYRTTRSVALSEAGRRLLPYAVLAVEAADKFVTAAALLPTAAVLRSDSPSKEGLHRLDEGG